MSRFFKIVTLMLSMIISQPLPAVSQEDAPVMIDAEDFAAWLEAFRLRARSAGISDEIIDQAFAGLEPNPRVIELDRRQPEFTITFQKYLNGRVTQQRVNRGKAQIRKHRRDLDRAADRFGVQGRFIAAIWGIETNFGGYTGNMSVIRSLATLAHDPRRSTFFSNELLNALKILDQGHITVDQMLGSWAGAMGQGQFMPSSFLTYARDLDGDGKANIWTDEGDAFASIANYLKSFKWDDRYTWGRAVSLPDDFDSKRDKVERTTKLKGCQRALKTHSRELSLADWNALGVRRLNGQPLPQVELTATLVEPAGKGGPAYLTYGNFRSVLRYNCSNYYAIAVGTLADRLRYR